jgi:hypothetical protein
LTVRLYLEEWMKEQHVLTPDELRRLLDAVKGERFEDVLYLCTPGGSRIGETLTPPTLSPTPARPQAEHPQPHIPTAPIGSELCLSYRQTGSSSIPP